MPTAKPPTKLYNDLLDSDQFHNSEIIDIEPAIFERGVRLITIDYEAAARRNIGYIRENIANRKKYEQKLQEESQ